MISGTFSRVCLLFGLLVYAVPGNEALIRRLAPGCKTSALDVAFLIDSSADVSYSSLRHFKNFVKRVVQAYDVSFYTVRPSISAYGHDVVTYNSLFDINFSYGDGTHSLKKSDVVNIISGIKQLGGRRRVGNAVQHVCDNVFNMARNRTSCSDRRQAVPKLIIVISAGGSADIIPQNLSCFNTESRGCNYDFTIIAIGITRAGIMSLKSMHVAQMHKIENAGRLLVIDNDVGKSLCDAAIHGCRTAYHDLLFLLDGSSSISSNDFSTTLTWMRDIAEQFTVGSQFTRVGMVQYGDEPRTEFDLNTFQNGSQVFEAISNVTQIGGESGPYAAILQVLRRSLTAQYGQVLRVNHVNSRAHAVD